MGIQAPFTVASVQDAVAAEDDGVYSDRPADVFCVEVEEDVDEEEAWLPAKKVRMISQFMCLIIDSLML
jgi:hypothetical protein